MAKQILTNLSAVRHIAIQPQLHATATATATAAAITPQPKKKSISILNHAILSRPIFAQLVKNRFSGIPLSALKVPYTDEKTITAEQLYTDPADPQRKYFLPVYQVGVERISGKQQFKIELSEATEGEGGSLVVSLEKRPPAGNGTAAVELPHTPEIALRFTVPGINVEKRLVFTELTDTGTGMQARLQVNTFNEFNQLFAALSESSYQCQLEIIRSFQVGQLKFTEAPASQADGNPVLTYTRQETQDIRGTTFIRFYLSVANWNAFAPALFQPAPDLPPCGLNKNASRTWIDIFDPQGKRLYGYCNFGSNENLQNFSFAVQQGQPLPPSCYIVLTDRRTNQRFTSNRVSLSGAPSSPVSGQPGEKLYSLVSPRLPQLEPFHFAESLHGYIYRSSGSRQGALTGFKPFRIRWEKDGIEYTYLQEEVTPTNFFFLPDHFALARKDAPLFQPCLNAAFEGAGLEDMKVSLSYCLEGKTDPVRLQDAASRLKDQAHLTEEVQLSPLILPGDQLSLKMAIPGVEGFSERTTALITLERIEDQLPPITLEQFELFFSNILKPSGTGNLMTGHLEPRLEGIPLAPVPVELRFTEVDPEVLILQPEEGTNLQVTIKNTAAVPVSAQGVVVTIQDGENTTTGSKAGLALPLTVEAGGEVSFTVLPDMPLAQPDVAVVHLLWEGLRQQQPDGTFKEVTEGISITAQERVPGFSHTLTNPIETDILIGNGQGVLRTPAEDIPLILKGITFPMTLAAGASQSFQAVPSKPTNMENTELVLSWDGLSASPKKEGIFESIVDTSVRANYQSTVRVSLFMDQITADSTLRLVKVEFKNASDGPLTGELLFSAGDTPNPENGILEKQIVIPLPIKDFILGNASTGEYWFRLILIRKTDGTDSTAGSAPSIGEWQSHSGSLEITTSMFPVNTTPAP